jgi:hypothetical protein
MFAICDSNLFSQPCHAGLQWTLIPLIRSCNIFMTPWPSLHKLRGFVKITLCPKLNWVGCMWACETSSHFTWVRSVLVFN